MRTRKSLKRILAEALTDEASLAWGLPFLVIAEARFWSVLRAALQEQDWGAAMVAGSMLTSFVRPDRERALKRLTKIYMPKYEVLRRRRRRTRSRTSVTRPAPSDAKWTPAGHPRKRRRLGYAVVAALLIEPTDSRIWRLRQLTEGALGAGWIFEAAVAARFTRSAIALLPGTSGLREADRELERLLRQPEVARVNSTCFNPIRDFIEHYRVRPDFDSPFGSYDRARASRAKRASSRPGGTG